MLDKIKFRDWTFRFEERDGGYLFQVVFMAPDNCEGGEPTQQYCRKWYISKHACENEVVRTAWKAVEAAVIHEAAEQFTFLGQRVMEPHVDFTKMAEFMKTNPVNVRT